MKRDWDDDHIHSLITLTAEDIRPLNELSESWIQSLAQEFVLVGVVTAMPNERLDGYFESDASDGYARRVMTGKGQVYKGLFGHLTIFSWLPGYAQPQTYAPYEDEDVIIGDLPLNEVNLRLFMSALKGHQPLPYRRSRTVRI